MPARVPTLCVAFLLWFAVGYSSDTCPLPTGQVTDTIGDTASATDPDLVSGSATMVGANIRLRARFVPGTFDPTKTLVVFALDTDQNPATGSPGIDSNGLLDTSTMGTDYVVSMGSTYYGNLAEVEQYVGPPPNTFAYAAYVPVTYYPDGIDAIVPLSVLGSNGQLNFVVMASSQVSARGFTTVLDVMPNVGLPPGTTTCLNGQPATEILSGGIVNAAGFMETSLAPGEMITIFGAALGPAEGAGIALTSSGSVGNQVANVQVLFDGVPAPLTYVQMGMINAVVPYGIAGNSSTQVQVTYNGQSSGIMPISVGSSAPGLFTTNASGLGSAAALNADYSVNSPSNPAASGSVVVLFATGEGQTDPPGVDGKPGSAPLPQPISSVSVAIGGSNAEVLYAGGAPGLVAGVLQLNVRLPVSNPSACDLPVVLKVGDVVSRPGVTISVQCDSR